MAHLNPDEELEQRLQAQLDAAESVTKSEDASTADKPEVDTKPEIKNPSTEDTQTDEKPDAEGDAPNDGDSSTADDDNAKSEETDDASDHSVPFSRFKQVNTQRKQAERTARNQADELAKAQAEVKARDEQIETLKAQAETQGVELVDNYDLDDERFASIAEADTDVAMILRQQKKQIEQLQAQVEPEKQAKPEDNPALDAVENNPVAHGWLIERHGDAVNSWAEFKEQFDANYDDESLADKSPDERVEHIVKLTRKAMQEAAEAKPADVDADGTPTRSLNNVPGTTNLARTELDEVLAMPNAVTYMSDLEKSNPAKFAQLQEEMFNRNNSKVSTRRR